MDSDESLKTRIRRAFSDLEVLKQDLSILRKKIDNCIEVLEKMFPSSNGNGNGNGMH